MNNPKALFPVVFATSWLGNLLLTVLAFYLAFTHQGPLTPWVFTTVALCILSGNALPIGVYWILVRWRQAELRAEAAEAGVRVREALHRAEEVLGRLDEAEGALAKSVLLARQVPERIHEALKGWDALGARLEGLQVPTFTAALESQSAALATLQQQVEASADALKSLRGDLKHLPDAVTKHLKQALPELKPPSPHEPGDAEVSLGERLDLLFESLESVQDSLDTLLQKLADKRTPPPFPATTKPEPEPAPPPHKLRKPQPAAPAQAEMTLDQPPPPTQPEPPDPYRDGKTRLLARAMIGISNRLFLRGDEPPSSWDEGTPMELVGIGEFAWASSDVTEPIEVSIRLNDEIEASGGPITLQPGQTTRVSPAFEKGSGQ